MKFVILGHFMNQNDMKNAFPLGKYIPVAVLEFITAILPPQFSYRVVGKVRYNSETYGWILGLSLTAKQMISLPKEAVRRKILAAVLYSQEKLDADILMLGALTSPLTSAGKWLTDNPKVQISVTTGNTYTAAISIEAITKIASLMNLDMGKLTIGIIGAAGVIGEAITHYFIEKKYRLLLIEKNRDKFDRLMPFLNPNTSELSCNVEDVIKADIVIVATANAGILVKPEMLKHRAVVLDISQPPALDPITLKQRPDVLCIDGGRIDWSNVDTDMNLGLPENTGFACMTEVILQSLENHRRNYVGSVGSDHMTETLAWAKKWGFKLAPFTSFNQPANISNYMLDTNL